MDVSPNAGDVSKKKRRKLYEHWPLFIIICFFIVAWFMMMVRKDLQKIIEWRKGKIVWKQMNNKEEETKHKCKSKQKLLYSFNFQVNLMNLKVHHDLNSFQFAHVPIISSLSMHKWFKQNSIDHQILSFPWKCWGMEKKFRKFRFKQLPFSPQLIKLLESKLWSF